MPLVFDARALDRVAEAFLRATFLALDFFFDALLAAALRPADFLAAVFRVAAFLLAAFRAAPFVLLEVRVFGVFLAVFFTATSVYPPVD